MMITVEVVYATPDHYHLIPLEVKAGTTAIHAVDLSGILVQESDLERDALSLGVFSHKVAHDHVLQAGDRVEIYRPLTIDPMEKRRRRAKPR